LIKKGIVGILVALVVLLVAIVPVSAQSQITFWSQCPSEAVVKLNAWGYDKVYTLNSIDEEGTQAWVNQNTFNIDVGSYPDCNAMLPTYFTVKITAPNYPLEEGYQALPLQFITPVSKNIRVPKIRDLDNWQYATARFNFNFPNQAKYNNQKYTFGVKIYANSAPDNYQAYDVKIETKKVLP
jgi:hypothetical protein